MKLNKFRFFARHGFPVAFGSVDLAINDKTAPGLSEHIILPEKITPDIITFSGKMVESGANLNRAYFSLEEMISAYDSIPYKAVDVEHELERIVGHIWSHSYVDRATNKKLGLDELRNIPKDKLDAMKLDVMIGGVVYLDRFPQLESPIKRKSYGLSMECYFSSYQLLLENGVKVTVDEATALGLDQFIDALMGNFKDEKSFIKAHTLKVILADNREVPMKVYKYLEGVMFSGVAFVLQPACPSCNVISTSYDEKAIDECMDKCKKEDDPEECMDECHKEMMESSASLRTQADEFLTINLTKLDRYMEQWRKSSSGKPINHQVKDNIISFTSDQELETSDDTSTPRTEPFSKDRDPLETDKNPATCPQYKYEIWVMNGNDEQQMRHWCTYANEKCPTAGDRNFHECNRWYNREGDWIYDTRNFRDGNNPFAPEGYDPEEPFVDSSTATVDYKCMHSMVDSFLYKMESIRIEKELADTKRSKKSRI